MSQTLLENYQETRCKKQHAFNGIKLDKNITERHHRPLRHQLYYSQVIAHIHKLKTTIKSETDI